MEGNACETELITSSSPSQPSTVDTQPNTQRLRQKNAADGRRTGSNSKIRGGGFTNAEVDSLLDAIETVLPIGGDDWSEVLAIHNVSWVTQNRKEDGLRRKFAKLYNERMPTGAPHMPPSVRRAKDLRASIVEKMDMGDPVVGNLGVTDVNESDNINLVGNNSTLRESLNTGCTPSTGTDQNINVETDMTDGLQYGVRRRPIDANEDNQSSRPLFKRRISRDSTCEMKSLMELLQMQIAQEGQRRDTEHRERLERERSMHEETIRLRELERQREQRKQEEREERRREDRERSEREQRRYDEFMQLMMMVLGKKLER